MVVCVQRTQVITVFGVAFLGGFYVDGVGFDLELRIGFGLFMHKFSAKKGACQISVYTFICFAVGWSREKNAELGFS